MTRGAIRFMGKAEVFKIPVLGAFFTALGGFPVARDGTDRKARARLDGDAARRASRLAVFPEGTRQHGPKIQPLQPGAAYLALRAGVPIVPVGIAGSEEILRERQRPAPALRPGRDRGRRADRAAAAHDEARVPRAEVDALTARARTTRCSRRFDEALELRDRLSGRGSGRRARRAPRTRRALRSSASGPPRRARRLRVAAERERGERRRARGSARGARAAAGSTRPRR